MQDDFYEHMMEGRKRRALEDMQATTLLSERRPPALTSHNLAEAQVALIESALDIEGTLSGAADMLGITRHALKRRIIANNIDWPRSRGGAS